LFFAPFLFITILGLPGAFSAQTPGSSKSDARFDLARLTPSGNQFYVSPGGSASGDGSINNPWDLKTALGQPSSVTSGSTIFLRGGTYNVPAVDLGFTSSLSGTADNPIIVTSYPGEWAVIDGNLSHSTIKNKTILRITGTYTWYVNFEITNTETSTRKIPDSNSNPSKRRGNGIDDYGIETKLINLVIHDAGQGIVSPQSAKNSEYYGNIIYNNGWDAPDRTHGHSTYIQNEIGTKKIENNIFFAAFSMNGQTGGSEIAHAVNLSFIGNTFFNGVLAWKGPNIRQFKVIGNNFYNNELKMGYSLSSTHRDAEVRNNYIMSGVSLYEFSDQLVFQNNTVWNNNTTGKNMVLNHKSLKPSIKFSIDNNIYYKAFATHPYWHFKINYYGVRNFQLKRHTGFFAYDKTTGSQSTAYSYTKKSWKDDFPFDRNSTYIDAAPAGTKHFLQPNRYDSRRANLIIYNWDQLNTVGIDVSSVLSPGDTYELRNVQDYFGDVITGTYSGGDLQITMTGRNRAKPIGYDQVTAWYHDPLQPNTFPIFGAFVLIKTN
jgi:hypothetical protein